MVAVLRIPPQTELMSAKEPILKLEQPETVAEASLASSEV